MVVSPFLLLPNSELQILNPMPSRRSKTTDSTAQSTATRPNSDLRFPNSTDLVGLTFQLEAQQTQALPSQYSIGLHAWFLQQVQASDPALSRYLHDSQSEKPFNLSTLDGQVLMPKQRFPVTQGMTYRWHLHGFSAVLVDWLRDWLIHPPTELVVCQVPFTINSIQSNLPAIAYADLLNTVQGEGKEPITLYFLSPTSFRRKGHHFPLPVPTNVFHSYLRRWNDFSGMAENADVFLDWIDTGVIVHDADVQTLKVAAGKSGTVTGFTGRITYGLNSKARRQNSFMQLFYALSHLAPYVGTGHKTTFGLGQTRLADSALFPKTTLTLTTPSPELQLATRIDELTTIFFSQRQRQGGDRARKAATTQATLLARREQGESLQAIADDLKMPYQTAKSYVKMARRSLSEFGSQNSEFGIRSSERKFERGEGAIQNSN